MTKDVQRLTTREEIFAHLQQNLADVPGISCGSRDILAGLVTDRLLKQIGKGHLAGGVATDSTQLDVRSKVEGLYARYRGRTIQLGDVVHLLGADSNLADYTLDILSPRIDATARLLMRGYFLPKKVDAPRSEPDALRMIFRDGIGGRVLVLDTQNIYRAALCEYLHPDMNKKQLIRMGAEKRHAANLEKLGKIPPGEWPKLAAQAGYAPLDVPVEPKPAPPAGRRELLMAMAAKVAAKKAQPAQG